MTDAKADSVREQIRGRRVTTDANHPLPRWPMAHIHPEPGEHSALGGSKAAAAGETERNEAVTQLARALRAAERAYRAYRAELGLGDVEPAQDWSLWYAEYLLGLG